MTARLPTKEDAFGMSEEDWAKAIEVISILIQVQEKVIEEETRTLGKLRELSGRIIAINMELAAKADTITMDEADVLLEERAELFVELSSALDDHLKKDSPNLLQELNKAQKIIQSASQS